MKIFSKSECTRQQKFPGIYRDKRDGMVVLFFYHPSTGRHYGLVLKSGDGSKIRSSDFKKGYYGLVEFSDYDVITDESFVIQND